MRLINDETFPTILKIRILLKNNGADSYGHGCCVKYYLLLQSIRMLYSHGKQLSPLLRNVTLSQLKTARISVDFIASLAPLQSNGTTIKFHKQKNKFLKQQKHQTQYISICKGNIKSMNTTGFLKKLEDLFKNWLLFLQ